MAMHMTPRSLRIAAVAAVAAALSAPVAAQARGGHHGQGSHADAHLNAERHGLAADRHGHEHAFGRHGGNVIIRGTVASVDGNLVTVDVVRGNRRGRALAGRQVQLDLSAGRVIVRDVNADGQRNLADVAGGDRVLAKFRVPRGDAPDLSQPFAARGLIDFGQPPATNDSSDSSDPSADTDQSST
jgi:hypothetical protein